MTPKLELRGVHKRFDDVQAVNDLSIELVASEFLSLLGPSGCGKSTTLSLIVGFESPDSGDILIDGTVINDVPPQRRRIGLVFQDYAVFSKLSVRENLAFGLEARRVPRAERKRAVAELAETLGLADLLDCRGDGLNMSEMQRVALGRVLIVEPELLLLDEPMSNLDAAMRADLRGELKQIQKDLGQTVLYVTHDQVEAMSMSDRIAVMDAGELLQVGTPDDIYHRPCNRFVAEFIGDPPINLVPCDVRRNGAGLAASTARHANLYLGAGAIEAGRHWLAMRPHDIAVSRAPTDGAVAGEVRFVENIGAEHVLHVDYGDDLMRVVVHPGFASAGDTVHLTLDARCVHLIDRSSERVVPRDDIEGAG